MAQRVCLIYLMLQTWFAAMQAYRLGKIFSKYWGSFHCTHTALWVHTIWLIQSISSSFSSFTDAGISHWHCKNLLTATRQIHLCTFLPGRISQVVRVVSGFLFLRTIFWFFFRFQCTEAYMLPITKGKDAANSCQLAPMATFKTLDDLHWDFIYHL